jgi:peptidoglycan/xylan/chitin deacetylase (PgdA/CDA1 family)
VLHEAGVPATFFIATSYVSQRRVFWWDRISYTLRRCELPRIRIRYPLPLELSLGGNADRATQQLLRYAKSHYELDMDRFLDELSAAAEVPWDVDTERRFSDELVMTWDHIRTLKKLGMDIQSHTRTHRILQNMPMSELFGELAGSRADLEEQIGAPVIAVSYPVGRSVARYPAIRFAAREAGYKVGFSNANGVTLLRGTYDPFDLHRIAVESNFPDHYFRALLAIPRLSESL